MIRKILKIKNIGRFADCRWRCSSELASMSLIFGENSRGKSTFSDIMRSFQCGTSDFIMGRKRLGSVGDCEADLLCEGNRLAKFRAGTWDSLHPEIAVFDSRFVHENVYAGDLVHHEHKKNLYRIIVGRRGIELAETVDELDGKLRDAGKAVSSCRDALTYLIPPQMELAKFEALPFDAAISSKIEALDRELQAVRKAALRAAEIREKGLLREVVIPPFPADLQGLLAESALTLADEAEAKLREHLAVHTHGGTERWLAEGVRIQRDGVCPFCAQGTGDLGLVKAYRSYFDEAYVKLKARVKALGDRFSAPVYSEVNDTGGSREKRGR